MADMDHLLYARTVLQEDPLHASATQEGIAHALIDIAESLRALAPKPWENQ